MKWTEASAVDIFPGVFRDESPRVCLRSSALVFISIHYFPFGWKIWAGRAGILFILISSMAGETESYLDVRGIRQWYQLWLSTHVGLHTSNIQQIRGKFCFPSNRQTSAGEDRPYQMQEMTPFSFLTHFLRINWFFCSMPSLGLLISWNLIESIITLVRVSMQSETELQKDWLTE